MESEGVLLLLIHEHVMMPWNNNPRIGRCCGRSKVINDGYYCNHCSNSYDDACDLFVHKNCVEDCSNSIQHPSHSNHTLQLTRSKLRHTCNLCGRYIKDICYRCEICDCSMHLYCAKYPPPPDVIDISETHHHKLTLFKDKKWIKCGANCGIGGYEIPYKCEECDLEFHVACVWHPSETFHHPVHPAELNHSFHSLHPLKFLTGKPPDYSDGKCRLCERRIYHPFFYHCSPCNFTLDVRCALNPPQISRLDLKTHDHQLTLLPRLDSFTCNACGLKGDRSPYVCLQCDFIIHQRCLGLPRLININRHDHRMSRTFLLGVENSECCLVCHKKVDRIWGGYSCQKCPGYVVHSKCATRKDVWNWKELEGVPEETEDIDPYVKIDDNTIQHFSHKEHYLRLHVNGVVYEENKRCNACNHHISFQSYYDCMEDCDFILHQNCAECPRKKRHVRHNERLTLITNDTNLFSCDACRRHSNGFRYKDKNWNFDIVCGSISEPFDHRSHLEHPLYYTQSDIHKECNGCKMMITYMLSCIEDDCTFDICFRCATLPKKVKHRVDDNPLSLCYGKKASGKLWCDICEKESNPQIWFYTCEDHQLCLHTKCVLGYFSGLMPRSTITIQDIIYEVVVNNSMSRPVCSYCKLRCIFPIILKKHGISNVYFCSLGTGNKRNFLR